MAEEKAKQKFKPNIWMISTIVLAIVVVSLIVLGGFLNSGTVVGEKTIKYINENLITDGSAATMINITQSDGMWLMAFNVGGSNYTTYISKNGKFLLLQAVEMVEQSKPAESGVPTTEKPVAELFVMSFCPYGVVAEKAMESVANILGDSATIEPHFIITVLDKAAAEQMIEGTEYTLSEKFFVLGGKYLLSLHGPNEAAEDVRQAVILKNYGQKKLWDYLSYVNNNCSLSDINTCWRLGASAAGLMTSVIESKMATDGLNAMIADQSLVQTYGVQYSPQLIINGFIYNGQRTSDAFKTAICSAFRTEPAACSEELSTSSTTVSGGCG